MLSLLLMTLPPNPCAAGAPVPATVAKIKAMPERYLGRCVTLGAWSNGGSLFTSRAELLRQERKIRTWRLPSEQLRQRMGVYSLPRLSEEKAHRQDRAGLHWRLTGVIDRCSDMIDRAEREIASAPEEPGTVRMVFAPGYCHYWSGPVLIVASATLEP